jgi:hypothetical protein
LLLSLEVLAENSTEFVWHAAARASAGDGTAGDKGQQSRTRDEQGRERPHAGAHGQSSSRS